MTHYSDNPGSVRVDYFKASGKWYMTESVDMSGHFRDPSVHEAVRLSLQEAGRWLPHFTIVVLDPHHQNSYPVMFISTESMFIPTNGAQ